MLTSVVVTPGITIGSDTGVPGFQVSYAEQGHAEAASKTGLSFVDNIAGNDTVTLSVTTGTLHVVPGVTNGLTTGQIAGNDTGTVTITAPISAINTTLNTASNLLYTGPQDAGLYDAGLQIDSNITFHASLVDASNNTYNASQTMSSQLANQTPVITVPSTVSAITNAATNISGLSFSDYDGGSSIETVTLSVSHGTLHVNAGASGITVTTNDASTATFSGTVSALNTAISANGGLQYTSTSGYAGSDSIAVGITDTRLANYNNFKRDNSYLGAAQSASSSFGVTVTSVTLTPTVVVTDAGGTYNGSPYSASASASVNSSDVSSSGSFSYTYYNGSSVGGSNSTTAPSAAGVYTVVATFTSPSYATASSSPVTFTIFQATPAVDVTDAGGTYNGAPFPASTTVLVGGNDVSSNGTVSYAYYNGSSVGANSTTTAPSAAGTYTVVSTFTSSNPNYASLSSDPVTFTIFAATPAVVVTDAGGPYSGSAFPASATVKLGSTDVSSNGTLSYTYYSGSSVSGSGLSTAPSAAGTYTVVATFTSSSANFNSQSSSPVSFTISAVTPTVVVTDIGGPFSGSAFPASATVKLGSTDVSSNGTLSYAYYSGSSVSGSGLSTAPSAAGTYTVVATFTSSSANFNSQSSAPVTFTISAATPTVVVTDIGGPYSGSAFTASATVKLGSTDVSSNGTLSYTYYSGSSVSGSGLSTAPSAAGTYTVVATFTSSSANYTSQASSPVTFTISAVTPTVVATDVGGTYSGSQFSASATVKVGSTDVSSNGTLSYTYYNGSSVSGSGLSTAPSAAGTYTVVASFTSSSANFTDHVSPPVTFTISAATPAVVATDASGGYTGSPFAASATVKLGSTDVSSNGTLSFMYYSGSIVSGPGAPTAPSATGTYTVVATFTSASPNFNNQSSAPVVFTISAATTTVVVTANGGSNPGAGSTFPASLFAATATATINGNVSVSNGGTFSYKYYSGTGTGGTGTTSAPTTIGTYTVVATFTSSNLANYSSGTSSPVTYTITGASYRFAIKALPSTIAAGSSTGPITVQVQDQYGNLVASDSSTAVTLQYPGGAVSGPVTVSHGIATFSGATLTTLGNAYFYASGSHSGTTLHIASASTTVVAAAPSKLVFITTPNASITAGVTEAPIQVAVEDQFGNVIAADASHITATFTRISGNGTGPTTLPTISQLNGKQYFSGIVFNTTGQYTMTVSDTADGLSPNSLSATTTVNPAAPTSMRVLTGPPATAVHGVTQITIQIGLYDTYGNLVTNNSSTVTFTSTGVVMTPINTNIVNGYASLNNLKFSSSGSYSLYVSNSSITSGLGSASDPLFIGTVNVT